MDSVVIVGCTKNSGSYINARLNTLVAIGQLFTTFQILIYENDSTDNTCDILSAFKSIHSNFDFIHDKYVVSHKVPTLAHGRNWLVQQVIEHYNDYTYMIMVDLDNVLDSFDPRQILNMYKYKNWDVLTSNSYIYYDIWALRMSTQTWSEFHKTLWNAPLVHDCWVKKGTIETRQCVKSYQKQIPVTYPLLEVESAFNGLAIYRISSIRGCKYSAKSISNTLQCEHVAFHSDIRKKGGRIFICPSIVVHCPKEHICK